MPNGMAMPAVMPYVMQQMADMGMGTGTMQTPATYNINIGTLGGTHTTTNTTTNNNGINPEDLEKMVDTLASKVLKEMPKGKDDSGKTTIQQLDEIKKEIMEQLQTNLDQTQEGITKTLLDLEQTLPNKFASVANNTMASAVKTVMTATKNP